MRCAALVDNGWPCLKVAWRAECWKRFWDVWDVLPGNYCAAAMLRGLLMAMVALVLLASQHGAD
jgi:hypothetical protein